MPLGSLLLPLCALAVLLPLAAADADGFTESFDPSNSSFYVRHTPFPLCVFVTACAGTSKQQDVCAHKEPGLLFGICRQHAPQGDYQARAACDNYNARDVTLAQGFQGQDVLQLGEYFAFAKFGSITDCNSPGEMPASQSLNRISLMSATDFNGVDGIIGFGLPVAHAPALPPPPPASMFGGMQVPPHPPPSKPPTSYKSSVPLCSRRRRRTRHPARPPPLRPHRPHRQNGRKQPHDAPARFLLFFNGRCG